MTNDDLRAEVTRVRDNLKQHWNKHSFVTPMGDAITDLTTALAAPAEAARCPDYPGYNVACAYTGEFCLAKKPSDCDGWIEAKDLKEPLYAPPPPGLIAAAEVAEVRDDLQKLHNETMRDNEDKDCPWHHLQQACIDDLTALIDSAAGSQEPVVPVSVIDAILQTIRDDLSPNTIRDEILKNESPIRIGEKLDVSIHKAARETKSKVLALIGTALAPYRKPEQEPTDEPASKSTQCPNCDGPNYALHDEIFDGKCKDCRDQPPEPIPPPTPPTVEERAEWFITLDYLHERDDCVGFELAKTLMGIYDESVTAWLRDREGDVAGTGEVE